jgi:hypothetical protein
MVGRSLRAERRNGLPAVSTGISVPISRRGKRQKQQIALIRKLWQEPVVEYEDFPTTGSTEPGYCRARNGRSRSGSEASARPRTTGRPGSGTDSCSRAGRKTEAIQIKARIVAKLRELGRDADAFGFESIQQYSRGATNGLAISRRGAKLGGATYPS